MQINQSAWASTKDIHDLRFLEFVVSPKLQQKQIIEHFTYSWWVLLRSMFCVECGTYCTTSNIYLSINLYKPWQNVRNILFSIFCCELCYSRCDEGKSVLCKIEITIFLYMLGVVGTSTTCSPYKLGNVRI